MSLVLEISSAMKWFMKAEEGWETELESLRIMVRYKRIGRLDSENLADARYMGLDF